MIKCTYNMGNNFILYAADDTFEYTSNKSTICITIFESRIIPYL